MDGSLLSSIRVQRRVIGAMVMREILTRYGRHNIGFLWLFAEPMLFTLGVAALWMFVGLHHSSSIPIVAFALTGYSSVLLWRNMPSRCVGAVSPNLSLMHHRNVRVIDIYAARLLLEMAGATASFILLGLVFYAAGSLAPPEDVLTIIGGWLLLAWFGASLGMVVGALSEISELVDKFWHPMAYLLFPLSGAAFVVDALPERLRDGVLLVPMVHGAEMVRDGYFGSVIKAHYDVQYLALWCCALSLFGLALVRIVDSRVAPE